MHSLYLDLTELLNNPIRTGIQRVEGELVKWWPAEVPLRIVRFDPNRGLVVLPAGTANCVRRLFTAAEAERSQLVLELQGLLDSPAVAELDVAHGKVRLVIPEVFYDPGRIEFYSGLTPKQLRRIYFLVFDLLPLTHPAYFVPMLRAEITCAYFRLIRMAANVGFISRTTRAAFYQRLRRSREVDGPAFYLGSDGLGPRPQSTSPPPSPVFSVIGTIEPRKNHAVILQAFRAFQDERPDAELRFYGNLAWCTPELRDTIAMEDGRRGFTFVSNPSDSAIREGIIESTATIYASSAEGFGLPPVESLWLGTPVVASRCIPSLENLDGIGVVFLDSIDEQCLVAAMRAVSSEANGSQCRDQIRQLALPTWQSFAREFCQWVQD